MTNWNSDYVAAHPPIPGDICVVTIVNGRRVALQSIADYEYAVAKAGAFAARTRHPIKVLCMSFRELLAFSGVSVAQFAEGMSPAVEQELLHLSIATCKTVLRECNDPNVREEAYRHLSELEKI